MNIDINSDNTNCIDKEDFINKLYMNDIDKFNLNLSEDNPKILFERLLYILNEGIKILFHDDITINELLNNDYNTLNKYINIIGYKLLFKKCHVYNINLLKMHIKNNSIYNNYNKTDIEIKYPDKPTIRDLINYKYIRSSNLNDYKYSERVKNIYHIIWFTELE
tara:strand:+ start:491 stop:982 length:492 start_codon:yes stop_codon:yes gene_type:complete